MGKAKIVFLAGWGRSGSTLIGNILNEIRGCFHVGELREIWQSGYLYNTRTGAGVKFKEDTFWMDVVHHCCGEVTEDSIRANQRLLEEVPRNTEVLISLLRKNLLPANRATGKYVMLLEKMYAMIVERTGSEVIIDSSKFPSYLALLARMDHFEIKVLHIVRDPRAAGYSWYRKPIHGQQLSVVNNALKWSLFNYLIEELCERVGLNRLLVPYESFCEVPQTWTEKILQFAEVAQADLPFVSPNEVVLRENHTVWGNPNRLAVGRTRIKCDEEWRRNYPYWRERITSALTFSLRRKYGMT